MKKIIILIIFVFLITGCTFSNENIIGETKYGINNIEVYCDQEKEVEYIIVQERYIIPRYNLDGSISKCKD